MSDLPALRENETGCSLDVRTRQFHAHLDGCAQCSAHPFDLCPIGQVLLMATALKEVPRFEGLNMEIA